MSEPCKCSLPEGIDDLRELERRLARMEAMQLAHQHRALDAPSSEELEHILHGTALGAQVSWILLTAAVVFFMQYGFALLEAGMCRKNNVTATYTKNILDAAVGTLVALFFGYELAYHESPMACGHIGDHPSRNSTLVCAKFFHHLVFQVSAATIVSGAMAERTTISAYTLISLFVSAIPFSVAVMWT